MSKSIRKFGLSVYRVHIGAIGFHTSRKLLTVVSVGMLTVDRFNLMRSPITAR